MKPKILLPLILALAVTGSLPAQTEKASTGLVMQEARAENLKVKEPKTYYAADKFDLRRPASLPTGKKRSPAPSACGQQLHRRRQGRRILGAGVQTFHPGVKFEYHMLTTRSAVPSLVFGVSDLGISRRVNTQELQLYQRYKNGTRSRSSSPHGSYNVTGWNPGFGIVVSQDNP